MGRRLKLYYIDIKYIRNLHRIDEHVLSVSPQTGKQNRPFLGVIVMVNGAKYCIPLTSNSSGKSKDFAAMRENITFRKVRDKKGNVLAALNLNNMIPVTEEHIAEINLRVSERDNDAVKKWKRLCSKELDRCQANQNEIEYLANELYRKYCSGEWFQKRKLCLNFPLLEKECKRISHSDKVQ